jgi:hypothetical protein
MAQRQALTWKQEPGKERFELAGEITEESDFAPLVQSLPSASTLDLAEVRRINSCGVREWLNFVTALSKAGKQIVLERCSVPMVAQMNMITNFRGEARVVSIFAPYHCPSCDEDHDKLIDLAGNNEPELEGAVPCPKCGEGMEFDELPESYLAFNRR